MTDQPSPNPISQQPLSLTNQIYLPGNLSNTSSSDESIHDETFAKEWSEQEEYLLALWADRALCYKLISERASRSYYRCNMYFAIPIIVLSTLSGSATLGMSSYVPPAESIYASAVIGLISLFTGVLTTLQTFFGYSAKAEAHRNASVSWGKLNRIIFTQLSLERNKRQLVKDFLRQSKNEYDRILEQSPVVPSDVLRQFVNDIKSHTNIMLPEECGNLIHSVSWEYAKEQRIKFLESKEALMTQRTVRAMSVTP
jgi:hypothetical protein